MKKLFHLCLLAVISAGFISCTKSAGDRAAPVSENAKMSRSRESANLYEL